MLPLKCRWLPLVAIYLPGIMFVSGRLLAAAELWDRTQPVPSSRDLSTIDGVSFHVIKSHAPQVDKFDWLHGVALVWHKGRLFASFGHNFGRENTAGEVANFTVSEDGGRNWSRPALIDDGGSHTDRDTRALAVSHGVFAKHNGKLWAFHGAFYDNMQDVHTRAYVYNDSTNRWRSKGAVVENGFWPMQEPERMDDGNWIMSGLHVIGGIGHPNNPAAVAISDGNDISKWKLVSLPKPTALHVWGESTVLLSGQRLLNISRFRSPLALTSQSVDFGKSWTSMQPSNLPMAASKPYAGTLSDGRSFLLGNTMSDTGNRRHTLTIATTKPHEHTFRHVRRIRDAIHTGPGETHRKAALSYPYAVEHEGRLYVGFSNDGGRGANRNSAELAIIPISALP